MSRGAIAGVAALLMGLDAALWANAASADSIKHESYQRASQSEACAARPGETVWQANWGSDSSWKPSWEQWANGGKGGWTCTRAITWAKAPVVGGSLSGTYALGDIGPGGGLVFMMSGGLTYEMAPKNWSSFPYPDPDSFASWCVSFPNDVPAASGTAIGDGAANTAAMAGSGPCSSVAASDVGSYTGGGYSDWFLPSKDELIAMCNYSRNPTSPPAGACTGAQNSTFGSSEYGFDARDYWSSSQWSDSLAWNQDFVTGDEWRSAKTNSSRVRPIRAF